MKRIYVNEKWCLGCHLCEYYCAFANSGKSDMVKALKNIRIHPRIHIEEGANGVHFAVNCRHCADPLCVKGCITGALTRQRTSASAALPAFCPALTAQLSRTRRGM